MELEQNMATVMRIIKEKNNKSLTSFSEELEISRSSLQEYLAGRGNPNLKTVQLLADKLEIDPLFLLSGKFSDGQLEILMTLLDTLKLLLNLQPSQRIRFAELLLSMVSLWDESS